MSVPYFPPSPVYVPPEEFVKHMPNLGYQVYFGSQESTPEIEARLHRFLSICYRLPGSRDNFGPLGSLQKLLRATSEVASSRTLLSDAEFQYYHTQFSKGMNGPLNYYRTGKFRYDEEHAAQLPSNLPSRLPVLTIWGSKDRTVVPALTSNAGNFIPNLQNIVLEDIGHWVMLEAKDEITEKVSSWLLEHTKPMGHWRARL